MTKATILSPYGTAETNAMLAHITFSVAEHSQHILGRALDFRLESRLFDAMTKAQAMQRRGIGWYPHSGFIHIDAGPIRNRTLDERGPDYLLIFDGQQGSTEPAERSLVAHGGRLPRYHNSSSSGSSSGQYRAAGYA